MEITTLKKAAVITVSDKCYKGEREDTSGSALREMLEKEGWEIIYSSTVPDEKELIKSELIKCSDELKIPLVLTTGGTGFSPRDVTPEAAISVIERRTPGIPEAMRAYSMNITPNACLSREEAGIRGKTLIINLPGSRKASTENLKAVIKPIEHGIEVIYSSGSAECSKVGKILSVNISEKKGTPKHPVEFIELKPDYGITGDAHAGTWHRQVSLLGIESIKKLPDGLNIKAGMFAENILTEGLCLYKLPVGTRLKIGTALCEVTQIGKECHSGCIIRKLTGDCVMPREGIFAKVLETGTAKSGDDIIILEMRDEKCFLIRNEK